MSYLPPSCSLRVFFKVNLAITPITLRFECLPSCHAANKQRRSCRRNIVNPYCRKSLAELLTIKQIFPNSFFFILTPYSQNWGTEPHQIWGGRKPVVGAPNPRFTFQIRCFASDVFGVDNLSKFFKFNLEPLIYLSQMALLRTLGGGTCNG